MSTTEVALSGVTATERIERSGAFDTSWIESTAPSDETQSGGRIRSVGGVARVLDRRDRRDVDLAVEERLVQLGRHAGDLLDVGVQPEEDRRHVHVADAAEADHRAPSCTRAPV